MSKTPSLEMSDPCVSRSIAPSGSRLKVAIWEMQCEQVIQNNESGFSAIGGKIRGWDYMKSGSLASAVEQKISPQDFLRKFLEFLSTLKSKLCNLQSKGLAPFDVKLLISRFTQICKICDPLQLE